jgi:ABC-type phosphate/phosphonate transport system substrate-binding protein
MRVHHFIMALSLFSQLAFTLTAEAEESKQLVMGGSSLGIRDSSKQDTEITFNAALADLLKSHGANLVVKVFDSTQDLYKAFDNNEIDGIFGTPLEFIQRESKMKSSFVAVRYKNVPLAQPFLVLVRTDDGIQNIKELRGKKCSLKPTQDMEILLLNTLLLENQQPEYTTFFSERLNPKNMNTGMMDVFFGKSDLTIVRESEYKTAVELNPQLGKKITVLTKSDPFLVLIGGARDNLSDTSHKAAVDSLFQLSSTGKGMQLMKIIHAESFDTASKSDLNNVRDLLKRYQALKAKQPSNSRTKIQSAAN